MTKSTHGGLRKGAGRKPSPEPRKRLNIYLAQHEIDKLKSVHKSISQAIRILISKIN